MKVREFLIEHSPEVLTGSGIALMITGMFLACKATLRASKKLEAKKKEKGSELTVLETVKTAGPEYILAAAAEAGGAICIGKGLGKQMEKTATVATALALEEAARRSFEEKAKEVIGEKKVNEIRDEIAKEKVENNPIGNREVIITGKGESLCMESLSEDYFWYDIDELKRTLLKAKEQTTNFMFISVNELRGMLGLKPLHPALGDLGWGPNTGFEYYLSYHGADDGRPCCVVEYLTPPKPRNEAG